MSSAIHYGQGLFEGCKAHHTRGGDVQLWNVGENSARLNAGAARMAMPSVDEALFREGAQRLVANNIEYVPSYRPDGTQGSLYVRPVLFGHGPQLGLAAAPRYTLCFLGMPVASSYYPGASSGLQPLDAVVLDGYDRAAPLGVGGVKCAG
jgi:branched-chain amino acid aminotransferase